MAQVKKMVKEPHCFDGISLDFAICLRWFETIEDYFNPNDALMKGASHSKTPMLCPIYV